MGWIGKNTPQGVIIFTSQNEVKPGEDVRFGIKTTEKNPEINWKALDSNGQVISSASTKITVSEIEDDKPELNKSDPTGINDDSVFRFIPDRPTADSNFRVIGENFVPGQSMDFYIGNNFDQTIQVDNNGRIFFTSKTPVTQDGERTEFVLRDSGGSEKIISFRVIESQNRDVAEIIKLTIGNTPKEVKQGEVIKLDGMATPSTTLTITTKHTDGEILNIQTIQVKGNGAWEIDQLVSPDVELGKLGIEVSDGRSKILRSVEVISPVLINVFSGNTMYQPGDVVNFSGKAIAGENMSIILEDSVGGEVFSRSITVGETGIVDFDIEISRDSVEGTYVLHLYQGNEEGVTFFGVGQEPEAILFVKPLKLNFMSNENTEILIQSIPNAQVSLLVIDSADREVLSDNINLGPDGKELYTIAASELSSGAYTINAKRGESSQESLFTVGFTTGSGNISIQTTKNDYKQNEQVLILGNTDSVNVLLDLVITDPAGKIIKKVETFSDRNGTFKIDNFRVPSDGKVGVWKLTAKSGSNFSEVEFEVSGSDLELIIELDKTSYNTSEIVNISGEGANGGATITLKIFNSDGIKVDELNINAKANGEYSTIWKFPDSSMLGAYEIIADDGLRSTSVKFTLN